jgi:hypothetical protein
MPQPPNQSYDRYGVKLRCDLRLPEAALEYRRQNSLLSDSALSKINLTAWLYRDASGVERVQVNPNETKAKLRKDFPLEKSEANGQEVGLHSEQLAAAWFASQRNLTVLQIFTERHPCNECANFLQHYYPGYAWYYYYDRRNWKGDDGEIIRRIAETLRHAYGL